MYCKQQFKFCMGIFGVPQDLIWFKYMENQELKKIFLPNQNNLFNARIFWMLFIYIFQFLILDVMVMIV